MADIETKERREASHVLGEMAASRLHDLIVVRLNEMAEREGLSQAELADRLGLKVQQVSRWISHPRNITVKSAGRLLGALDAQLVFELERFEDQRQGNQAHRSESVSAPTTIPLKTGNLTLTAPVSTSAEAFHTFARATAPSISAASTMLRPRAPSGAVNVTVFATDVEK